MHRHLTLRRRTPPGRRSRHLSRIIGICGLLVCLADSAAMADPPAALWNGPESFPRGLTTWVAAQATGAAGNAFAVDAAGTADPGIAQLDVKTGVVWLPVRRDVAEEATTLRVPLQPRRLPADVWIARQQGGFQFYDRGQPVLFFQESPLSLDGRHGRAAFVHPLWGLDGELLTEVLPADHRHHHGVFWAWHQLWVGDERAGDPWVTEDFLTVVRHSRVIQQGPVFATLHYEADWTSPRIVDADGRPQPIVTESTRIRVFRALADVRYVDFEIVLRPRLPDVRLGGAENERGYSGFTVRVRPPQDMQITDESGALAADSVGRASRWSDVSGRFAAGQGPSGLAMLGHPDLPEFPSRWLLRFYGMQNVVYPGRDAIRLSADAPLTLRHRLVLHRGDGNSARIADHQAVYESTP